MTDSAKSTPEEQPTTSESTLNLYGYNALIGTNELGSKELGKPFAFTHIDYKTEAEIDKKLNKKGGAGKHPAKVVTEVLAHTLTEWGGDSDFETKNHKHKLIALQNAFYVDILYAWCCLRIQIMGEILGLDWTCSECDHEFPWETDLNGLEVTTTNEMPEPTIVILNHKIHFGEITVSKLKILPPRWAGACKIRSAQRRGGIGDIKAHLLRTAILCMVTEDDKELPLAPRVFELLRKRDRERAIKTLDSDKFPQCDMSFEVECPECGFVQETSVVWTWDFFFGSASLPSE